MRPQKRALPARSAGSPAVPDRRGLVPLWTVRCATALLAVLLGSIAWSDSVWILLPVVVAAGAAVLPSVGVVSLSLLLLVVAYAVNVPAGSPWLLVFVAGLHAVFILYLLLLHLPLRGWISTAALRQLATSFLRIQALAQPVAVLALVVGDAGTSLPAVLVGVMALIAWAVWLIRRPGEQAGAAPDGGRAARSRRRRAGIRTAPVRVPPYR